MPKLKIKIAWLIVALLCLIIAGLLCPVWLLDNVAKRLLAYVKRLSSDMEK